jgi:23S rRNA pseudouridine2605 synthase
MKKSSYERNKRDTKRGGRSEGRQSGRRSKDSSITRSDGPLKGRKNDDKDDRSRSDDRRSPGGRNTERFGSKRSTYQRSTERRREDPSKGSERPYNEGDKDDRGFKKENRPYKAGTRPAGRRAREEGERRPRTTSASQRDEIRKDRTFDRQERPFKSGTRPSGKNYGYEEGSSEKRRSGGNRSYGRGSSDRDKDKRYGEKRNFRDQEKSYSTQKSDDKVRLNKYIANSGICSRREADDLIAAGVISVNGAIVTEMGYKISPGDVVKYNDKAIRSERLVYVLLNKPKDFITTTDDPQNRRTVMNLIQGAGRERIYPVGRLDRATTGVLLFTNDGELTKKLTHPSHEIKKIYQVDLDRALKSSDLDKVKTGIELEDGLAHVDEIFYSGDSKKTVGVELHSGKNRIVRRIFEELDYRVVKLDRVYFAGLTKKDLPRGRWRFLTEVEIANLKMLTAKKHKKSVE